MKIKLKTLDHLKQCSGKRRLLITLSIVWGLLSFITAYSLANNNWPSNTFDPIAFITNFILFSLPVWLNWLTLWIYKEYRDNKQISLSQKRTLWILLAIFIFFLAIYKMGFVLLILIVSIPVWLSWLIYWIILGYKK